MGFEQAAIKVQKQREFGELKTALGRIFAAENVERFLKKLQGRGVRIRDFDLVLASGVFEELDDALARPGNDGRKLYQELTTSDQAQLREFYLSKIEEVEAGLRAKYQKIYRYY